SLDDLLKWNRMTPKSRINIGDKILIRKGKTAPEPEKVRQEPDKESPTEPADSPGEEIIHVVAKGENPYMIAKKYGVSLDDLLKWNNMTSKSRINIGDKIIIRKGKR
ncbi:MAG TPA: LysM peptidoglycan-binding domain-containing protein, partial [Candidatus Hydrogenedentes bacterium]|nr:LysM peptidoglycan-binding domain-containing protein [Candidatus Hydrogenedentota bacterium]